MTRETDLASSVASADNLPDASDVHDSDTKIPIEDVFNEAFLTEYTEFNTFDEMVAASPSEARSADELDQVPSGAWDEFVADRTAFDNDEKMVMAARDHWVAERLGL